MDIQKTQTTSTTSYLSTSTPNFGIVAGTGMCVPSVVEEFLILDLIVTGRGEHRRSVPLGAVLRAAVRAGAGYAPRSFHRDEHCRDHRFPHLLAIAAACAGTDRSRLRRMQMFPDCELHEWFRGDFKLSRSSSVRAKSIQRSREDLQYACLVLTRGRPLAAPRRLVRASASGRPHGNPDLPHRLRRLTTPSSKHTLHHRTRHDSGSLWTCTVLLFLSCDLAVIIESMAFARILDRSSVIANVAFVTCWITGVLGTCRADHYLDKIVGHAACERGSCKITSGAASSTTWRFWQLTSPLEVGCVTGRGAESRWERSRDQRFETCRDLQHLSRDARRSLIARQRHPHSFSDNPLILTIRGVIVFSSLSWQLPHHRRSPAPRSALRHQ